MGRYRRPYPTSELARGHAQREVRPVRRDNVRRKLPLCGHDGLGDLVRRSGGRGQVPGTESAPAPLGEGRHHRQCEPLVLQRSKDQGRTWDRREWAAPGFESLIAFSRATQLADGTALVPVYGVDLQGKALSYVWRSDGGSDAFRLLPIGPHASGVRTDETCFLEVSPGRVLAHSRNETGYLSEMWSEDAGKTWSHPTLTEIWTPSSPPHLLKLTDGRILCSFGYRREPMGVRAVLSSDSGETWDIANTVVLRDDGGTPSGLETPEEVDLEELRPFRWGVPGRGRQGGGVHHVPEAAGEGRRGLRSIGATFGRQHSYRVLHHTVRRRNLLRGDEVGSVEFAERFQHRQATMGLPPETASMSLPHLPD